MTEIKTRKRSFLASVIGLLLCIALLAGTTLAWFTDSVSSEDNQVNTGTLKVDMYNADGDSIKETGKAFFVSPDQGWEPGFVQLEEVTIKNFGSLHFKYRMSLVPNGELSILADVVDVYVVNTADAAYQAATTREETLDAMTYLGTVSDVINNKNGFILTGNTSDVKDFKPDCDVAEWAIALRLQTTADNRYQDMKLCAGGFNIALDAAQLANEADVFGNDYDTNATFSVMTLEGLLAAAAEGGSIKLDNDILMGATTTIEITKDTVIDLNGYSLIKEAAEVSIAGIAAIKVGDNATLTISNGTIDVNANADYNTTLSYGIYVEEGATLNVMDGVVFENAYVAVCVKQGTANIYGGEFIFNEDVDDYRYMLNCIDTYYNNGEAHINVYGGIFHNFDPADNASEGDDTNYVVGAEAKSVAVGDTFVVVPFDTAVVATADELIAAIAKGGNIVVTEDITLDDPIDVKENIALYGNGATKITSNGDRVLNIQDQNALNIEILGVDMQTADANFNRVISIYNSANITLTIDNCDMACKYYALNVAADCNNVVIRVSNSTITGYCAAQTWSNNTTFVFENCTLVGNNNAAYAPSNTFGTIRVNADVEGTTITATNCIIEANSANGNDQYHLIDEGVETKVECENCTYYLDGNKVAAKNLVQ